MFGLNLSMTNAPMLNRRLGALGALGAPTREEIAALVPVFWDFSTAAVDDGVGVHTMANLGTAGAEYDLVSGSTTLDPVWDKAHGAFKAPGFSLSANKIMQDMYVYSSVITLGNAAGQISMSTDGRNITNVNPRFGMLSVNRSGLTNNFVNTAIMNKNLPLVTRTRVTAALMEAHVNGELVGSAAATQTAAHFLYQHVFGRAGDGLTGPSRYYAQIWVPDTADAETLAKIEHYLASLHGATMPALAANQRNIVVAGQSLAEHFFTLYEMDGANALRSAFARHYGYGVEPLDAAAGSLPLINWGAGSNPAFWDHVLNQPGPSYTTHVTPYVGNTSAVTDVVWSQGEQDSISAGFVRSVYKGGLKNLCIRLNADFGGKVIIQQMGRTTQVLPQPGAVQDIREVQVEVANELAFVSIGAIQNTLPLSDVVHLTNAGYSVSGKQAGTALAQAYGLVSEIRPTIVSMTKVGESLVLTLDKGSATSWTVGGVPVASADLTPAVGKTSQFQLLRDADKSHVEPVSVALSGDTVTLTYAAGVLDTEIGTSKMYNCYSDAALVEYSNLLSANGPSLFGLDTVHPISLSL